MAYRQMTSDEQAVLAEADRLGLVPDKIGPGRSRFINDLRRDVNKTRAMVAAAARILPSASPISKPTPVAASSVRSTDKRRQPATVSTGNSKPVTVTSERISPPRPLVKATTAELIAQVQTAQAAMTPAVAAAPTEYPSFWARGRRAAAGAGRGHCAATITAAAQISAQRATQPQPQQGASTVHAAGDTTRLIRAEHQRQAAQVVAAQASRAGHYNPHNLIAAAGDNAKRLADAQRAELDRMARERAGRIAG